MNLITSEQDLISYLTSMRVGRQPKIAYVTTSLRRDVMAGEMQGKFIHEGQVHSFNFKSLGGGVYEASINGNLNEVKG